MNSKKRILYFILIIITIPFGVGTRTFSDQLPYQIATYGGDVLAATCIFWGVRFVSVKPALWKITLYAYLISIAIETLQLYQAPWIQAIRHTPPFGIILGYGFLWSDWICYAVGVLIAYILAGVIETAILPTPVKAD